MLLQHYCTTGKPLSSKGENEELDSYTEEERPKALPPSPESVGNISNNRHWTIWPINGRTEHEYCESQSGAHSFGKLKKNDKPKCLSPFLRRCFGMHKKVWWFSFQVVNVRFALLPLVQESEFSNRLYETWKNRIQGLVEFVERLIQELLLWKERSSSFPSQKTLFFF